MCTLQSKWVVKVIVARFDGLELRVVCGILFGWVGTWGMGWIGWIEWEDQEGDGYLILYLNYRVFIVMDGWMDAMFVYCR